jgi:hypothetical protein
MIKSKIKDEQFEQGPPSPRPSPPGEGDLPALPRGNSNASGRDVRQSALAKGPQNVQENGRAIPSPGGEGQGEGGPKTCSAFLSIPCNAGTTDIERARQLLRKQRWTSH